MHTKEIASIRALIKFSAQRTLTVGPLKCIATAFAT